MEEHETEDYAVLSKGKARVFGHHQSDLQMRDGTWETVQWNQQMDAWSAPRPQAKRDLQVCAIWGKQCEWCDQPAVGYVLIPCDCSCGGREWVCQDDFTSMRWS